MENLVVDSCAVVLRAGDGTAVGRRDPVPTSGRLVWASMSTRYHPSHPVGEVCLFGMDFSFILPAGAAVSLASLVIFLNAAGGVAAPEWVVGPVQIDGLRVFARCSGGTEGNDYQFLWSVTDSDGNVFPRTALVLCTRAL